jgi:DUF4097 and DUF4098 domain-containing protein YvlB
MCRLAVYPNMEYRARPAVRLRPLAALTLAGSSLLGGCVVNVDSQALIVRDEKRFDVAGTPDVRLTTADGSIEIRSWDRAEVLVEIEKRGANREAVDALEVVAEQKGDRIELEVKRPREESFHGFGFHQSASAKLIVSVPAKSDIMARSGDGSIRVDRVSGRLELTTGDGSIRARDVDGELTLTTGDGSVTVEEASGRLGVETGDGSVSVSGRLASLRLKTGDGSIVYRADSETRMDDDWDVSTGDGTVTLYLPPDFSAELDAHTGDGSIRNELRTEAERTSRGDDEGDSDRRSLRTRLGQGGRTLRVRTDDGSIRIRAS